MGYKIWLLVFLAVLVVTPSGVVAQRVQPFFAELKESNVLVVCVEKQRSPILRMYYDEWHRIMLRVVDVYRPHPGCPSGIAKFVYANLFTAVSQESWSGQWLEGARPLIAYRPHGPSPIPPVQQHVNDNHNGKLQPIYQEMVRGWVQNGEFVMTLDQYCRLMRDIDPSPEGRTRSDQFQRRMETDCIQIRYRPNAPIMVNVLVPRAN
jgi:hypothetical protein